MVTLSDLKRAAAEKGEAEIHRITREVQQEDIARTLEITRAQMEAANAPMRVLESLLEQQTLTNQLLQQILEHLKDVPGSDAQSEIREAPPASFQTSVKD